MARILVVEDDPVINQVIVEFLHENNHEVVAQFDGKKALSCFYQETFDLLILDIMLPGMSGIDILKKIRETSDVAIMMLTAVDDEYSQLVSFNHLISDYVVKPFSPLILMKRVENILRHQEHGQSKEQKGELYLDFDNCAIMEAGQKITLTKKEYAILEVLFRYRGRLVTRDQLMNTVWGYNELDSRVLDNHIKNIRKKCSKLPLKTMTGLGYKLEEN